MGGVDGMSHNLMPCGREQGFLMPPSLQEWLPEGGLAWFILDVVGRRGLRPRDDGGGVAVRLLPGGP